MYKNIAITTLLWLSVFTTYSQNVITGIIKDDVTKEVLIGASVIIPETNQAVLTDIDGKFSIEPNQNAATLVVSYVGYKTKKVNLPKKAKDLEILLNAGEVLEEVLVVGYGTVPKSDKTGAIESIKPKDKDVMQYNDFQDFLQGRAAGVQVLSNGNELLSPNSIRIRGGNSLRGDNEPIYVVDGIIVNSSSEDTRDPLEGGSSFLSSQNGLNGINVQDIESIEILKDASATAIYGSRGANGVILITTKKGQSGKTRLNYRTTARVGRATNLYENLNGDQFADYVDEFRKSQGWAPAFYKYADGSIAAFEKDTSFMIAKADSIPKFTPINWYDEIFQQSFAHNHRITASGGSDKNNYYVGTGFGNATGIIPGTKLTTTDFILKYTHRLSDRITLSPRLSATYTYNKASKGTENLGSSNASLIRHIVEAVPLENYDLNNVTLDVEDAVDGPRAWLKDYDDDSGEFRTLTSLTTDIQLSDIFTFRILGGLDYRNKNRKLWYGTSLYRGSLANGEAGISNLERYRYNIDNTLMFKKDFGVRHKINGTVGFVFDELQAQNTGTTASNFINKELRYHGISYGQVFSPVQYFRIKETILSYLARINYTFHDKFLFTTSFRSDGSSKFRDDNKWSFFPSFALAWKMKSEPFMRNVRLINDAKLRIGYGQTGSQAIQPYQTISQFSPTANFYSTGSGNALAITANNLGNEKLKWETTTQLNVGLDFGIMEDRFTGSVDIYHKLTSDLLQVLQVGPSLGFPAIITNVGDIQNRGMDLGVTANILEGKFKWKVNTTLNINRNKIKNLGTPEAQFGNLLRKAIIGQNVSGGTVFKVPANIFIEGEAAGLFWGYQTNGIIQDQATLENAPAVQGVDSRLGDILYVDQNGDKNINELDLTIIGNPNPKFNVGLSSELSYKKWNLTMFFNAVQGFDIANGNLGRQGIPTGLPNNNIIVEAYENAWRPGSTNASYPRLGYDINGDFTDRMVEDGSFVRLSFVSLAYSLPKKWLKGMHLSAFVTGHNLWLLTNYSGFDPEVNSFSFDSTRRGVDWSSFPNQKSVSFGLNAEF
jgi:TonB-linked SusC/RagA family outer membrane protein